MRAILPKLISEEGGQTLPIVLMLLLGGMLLITATLALTSTSIKSGKQYKDNLMQFYAADAGMEEAVRAIRKNTTDNVTTRPIPPIDYPPFVLNGSSVIVTMAPTDNFTHFVTSVATGGGKTTTITSLVRWTSNLMDYAVTSRSEIETPPNPDQWEIDGPTYPGYDTPWPTAEELKDYYWAQVPYVASQERFPTSTDNNTGDYTFTGGASLWQSVNDASDATYITGVNNSGGRATFGFDPFDILSGATITNLTIYYRAAKIANPSANIRASLKVGGTYYDLTDAGVNPTRTPTITTYSGVFAVNPQTGAAWTVADINGTGSNPLQAFGVSSTDLNPDVNVYLVYAQVNSSLPADLDIAGLPTIGPGYRDGDLKIYSTMVGASTNLTGTIYVSDDLEIGQTNQDFILNLNGGALFAEGSIDIGGKTTIRGSGIIIALGDVTFMPRLDSGSPDDFIFVMSLNGEVYFSPSGNFYGAVAGNLEVDLQPLTTITWTQPPYPWNLPFPIETIGGPSGRLKYLNYTIR